MEIEIKYWNRKRGENTSKIEFSNPKVLYDWLDTQERISGQFIVKVNMGYAKNPKQGSTMVANFKNAQVIQVKSMLNSVINRCKQVSLWSSHKTESGIWAWESQIRGQNGNNNR